jgi:integrase
MDKDKWRIKFTNRTIAALPTPAGGRAEYIDTETNGLRLRVSPKGVKTFSLLRRVKNGPMERITLGRYPDIKTEEAARKAKQLNGVIAEGANPAELRRAHRGELTFAELFDEYIERHAKLRKRTWKEDAQKYRDYIEKHLAGRKISGISRQDIAAIHSKITRAGHPTVANRVKDLLSSIFGRAVKWGLLDANPAAGIEDNKETSRDRFLRPGELPKLFEALSEEHNSAFRDFFLLALLTGARRHNVRSMRWADIDLDSSEWRIPMTKNGQPQHVPLVPEAVAVLRQRREAIPEGEFVFPAARTDSKLGHISGERKAWLRILDRAGIEDVRIHDLRRTMGSWQARTGASMVIIGKSLGHKSQQATAIYARLDLDPVRQSMETAAAAIMEAAGITKPAAVKRIRGAA